MMDDLPLKKVERRGDTQIIENEAEEWFARFARFGYMAKGAVYLITGVLAAQAAFTLQTAPDTTNTLYAILTQPFGMAMLTLVVFGLSGYVLWRFVMALADPERKGSGPMGLANRAAYIGSGIAYATVVYTALDIMFSERSTNGGGPDDWTAWLLMQPFGDWILGIAGAIMLGVALEEIHRGYTASFRDYCDLDALGRVLGSWALRAGRYGLIARGLIYGLIGALLLQAALEYDPTDVEGVGSALRWVEQQSFGPLILLVLSAGLIAYGLFALAEGRCRKIGAT